MHVKAVDLLIILACFSCQSGRSQQENIQEVGIKPPTASSLSYEKIEAIPLPRGFNRSTELQNSFTHWLRQINLKKEKTVYLYDGTPKANQSAQWAVLDISVGKQNLQQCADAVMRLRAEYLYAQQRYSEISFTDNNQKAYTLKPPFTKTSFNQYLQRVFGMCGSASLSRQMHTKNIMHMQPGDVLIKGGFPGHAVIVVDMAQNRAGEKIYLLAQSYMPAQDIHILKNPMEPGLSPWYRLSTEVSIPTPEYSFTSHQLKGW